MPIAAVSSLTRFHQIFFLLHISYLSPSCFLFFSVGMAKKGWQKMKGIVP